MKTTANKNNVDSRLKTFEVQGNTQCLFGVNVHSLTMQQVLENIDKCITLRHSLHIGMLNAAKIINMRRSPALDADVKKSNMILADGSSILVASRLLGRALPERVTGIDLMLGIFSQGSPLGYRIYCLGATPKVLEKVQQQIALQYPGIIIAGAMHGYFSADEEIAVAEKVARSGCDILLVAMTSPKKEQFMARWGDVMNVPVVHGVGGSFDVLAGLVKRAPAPWQKLGLEWLYRVLQEPKRLWRRYLVTNTLFMCLLTKEIFLSLCSRVKNK